MSANGKVEGSGTGAAPLSAIGMQALWTR